MNGHFLQGCASDRGGAVDNVAAGIQVFRDNPHFLGSAGSATGPRVFETQLQFISGHNRHGSEARRETRACHAGAPAVSCVAIHKHRERGDQTGNQGRA